MSAAQLAFVGDVHGEADYLSLMLSRVEEFDLERIVFLGDYVNRGSKSAQVVELLSQAGRSSRFTFLRGNHEQILLRALDSGDLAELLSIGGAATIASYLQRPAHSNVLEEFRAAIPEAHMRFLRTLEDRYEGEDVVASHMPVGTRGDRRYRISGHVPVGALPRIGRLSSSIDTGSGLPGGRLTALLWPSRTYAQTP